jgi:hypothetical protein
MSRRTSIVAAALLVAATSGAMAQQPSAQDHEQHHPAGAAAEPSTPPSPPTGGSAETGPGGAGTMPTMRGPASGMMGSGGMMRGPGGMMGGGMMGGPGGMMGGGAGMPTGVMAAMANRMAEHVEGRLAFLKTELKITESQEPQWNAFAEAVRANAKAMKGVHPASGEMPKTLPERLDLREKMLAAHLDALRNLKSAATPLYAALSDEQKKSADELILAPMGMM